MKPHNSEIIPQIAKVIEEAGWTGTFVEPDKVLQDRAYLCYKVYHRGASITMDITAGGIELSRVVAEVRDLCRMREKGNRIPGEEGLDLSIRRINSSSDIKARFCKGRTNKEMVKFVLELKGKFNPNKFVAGFGKFIGSCDRVLRELLSD